MKHNKWFECGLVIGIAAVAACEVEREGRPRSAAISDDFGDAIATSWAEDVEMVTEVRADDEVVVRARWDFESGAGWIETSIATIEVDVPEAWTGHDANEFAYDVWRESVGITDVAGARPELSPSGGFRDAECSVSYDCCNAYISCSVCSATSYGEHCTVLGSGPIPLPDCACVEV